MALLGLVTVHKSLSLFWAGNLTNEQQEYLVAIVSVDSKVTIKSLPHTQRKRLIDNLSDGNGSSYALIPLVHL